MENFYRFEYSKVYESECIPRQTWKICLQNCLMFRIQKECGCTFNGKKPFLPSLILKTPRIHYHRHIQFSVIINLEKLHYAFRIPFFRTQCYCVILLFQAIILSSANMNGCSLISISNCSIPLEILQGMLLIITTSLLTP